MIFLIEKCGQVMGMVGLVILFVFVIGLIFFGWVVEVFFWRLLFYIILLFVVIDLIFVSILMKNVMILRKIKIDILLVIFLIFGFGGFLYGFLSVGFYGWISLIVLILLLVGVIVLFLFIIR